MIDHNRKFIFIDICRTGSTSIRVTLSDSKEKDINPRHHNIGNRYVKQSVMLTDNQIKNYFKFTIVRNPYDRLVSLWLWGYSKYNFSQFVNLVKNNKISKGFKYRYMPMIDWIRDKNNKIHIDYIGRFENLNFHFSEICKRIKIDTPVLKKLNTGNERSGIIRKEYREYYNDDTKRIVTEIYKEDLERFKYSF